MKIEYEQGVVEIRLSALSRNDPHNYNPHLCSEVVLPVAGCHTLTLGQEYGEALPPP